MAGGTDRMSMYTSGSGETEARNGEQKKNLWTSMLESVASGKRLPEKNLLVLGKHGLSRYSTPLALSSIQQKEDKRNEEESRGPYL